MQPGPTTGFYLIALIGEGYRIAETLQTMFCQNGTVYVGDAREKRA
jgi:hypothetical protein